MPRERRAGRRAADGGAIGRHTAGDGGGRQRLRHARVCRGDARDERHATCVAKPQASGRFCDRRTDDTTCRLPDQSAETEADGRSVWLDEDSGDVAQDTASGRLQSGMGVHLCGRRLQPRAHAESAANASSLRISRGRSVSGARTTWLLGAYSSTAELTNGRKRRQEEKNEKADRFDYPFFSSLLVGVAWASRPLPLAGESTQRPIKNTPM